MSESMSSPWIRDYLIDVAETFGSQLYNSTLSKKKKKVQLTDFLTYQENSYVWAWISDKDYRVSVRISKDAVNEYKSKYGRSIIDCRFFLVFITSYRPMFSPRPLGPNLVGNTRVSHISLDIGHISFMGTGRNLFGNPRDLESHEKMNEWFLGLRQDGGGGNILKSRKQQELARSKKLPPSPPSPPPFSLYAPVSQRETTKVVEDVAIPKHERPQDFKRAYAKRWRRIGVDLWKFATKPAAEERSNQSSHSLVESHLDTANLTEPCDRRPSRCPLSPRHIPSPTSLQRQGTPTEWSPSNRGSPLPPDEANTVASGMEIQQHNEPHVLPTTSHLPSTSHTRSPQPPTPAQRTKHSPLPRSSPLPCSFPDVSTLAPIPPSQQLPCSSPPPPSSSLPLPLSSLPIPMGIRKSIQRKVPYPELPPARPDPTKQGPVQILVPNSDTSGTGSSQPCSQSQRCQPPPRAHPPTLQSHPEKELEPAETSTPSEGKPLNSTRPTSKMFAESSPTHGDIDSLEEERTASSQVPNGRNEDQAEKASPVRVPRHDSEAWKEPTFIAKLKGKGKARAVEELGTPNVEVGQKRQRSAQLESPTAKRTRISPSKVRTARISHHTRHQDTEASTTGKINPNNRPSTDTTEAATPPLALQLSKPRLANFIVDFERIDLGKGVPTPKLDLDKDIKGTLLRTGRIRKLGEVEKDGSVYIYL